MYCLKCNQQYSDQASFCPKCGEPTGLSRGNNIQDILKKDPVSIYCDQCGAELEGGERFCHECGNPVEYPNCLQCGALLADGVTCCPKCGQKRGERPSKNKETNAVLGGYPHPYHKLGGLLLFIVVMGYIGAVGCAISAISSGVAFLQITKYTSMYGAGMGNYSLIMFVVIVVEFICCALIIWWVGLIRKKDSRFLHVFQVMGLAAIAFTVIYYGILGGVLGGLYNGLAAYGGYGYGATIGFSGIMMVLLAAAVPAVSLFLWNMYYTKSVRVRTYMGSDEYLRKSLFNKNTPSPIPADRVPYQGQM